MDQDNAMHMSMQMSFEASTAVTLWFKQWHTHSLGTYLLSCAGLVALCLLHEILHAYRNAFHEQYVTPKAQSEYDRLQAPAETAEDGSGSKGYVLLQLFGSTVTGTASFPPCNPLSHDNL